MSNDVLLFPSLSEELSKRLRFQKTKYTFFYTQTDIEFPYRNGVTMSLDGNNLTAVITNLFPSHSYECWITAEKDGNSKARDKP